MNTALVIVGVFVLIFGGILAFDGYTIMESSQGSFFGIEYVDEEAYNYGVSEMIFGIFIGLVGLILIGMGETEKTKPQPPTVVFMPPQPQYPPQPGYQPAPPTHYAPPPIQQPPRYPSPPYAPPYPQQPMQPPPPQQRPPVVQQPPPPQSEPAQVKKEMVLKCQACGYSNLTGAKFCNECGKPL